jgi:multiple sugar transport system ATP-binding protein
MNDVLPKDRDVAMVFQNYGLYPHMTVRTTSVSAEGEGVKGAERDRRIRAAAEKVELGPLLHRKPRELSAVSASASLSLAHRAHARRSS